MNNQNNTLNTVLINIPTFLLFLGDNLSKIKIYFFFFLSKHGIQWTIKTNVHSATTKKNMKNVGQGYKFELIEYNYHRNNTKSNKQLGKHRSFQTSLGKDSLLYLEENIDDPNLHPRGQPVRIWFPVEVPSPHWYNR